jgi:hypothetical protein
LTDPAQRASYLREGLKRVSRVIVFAIVMDAIYQFMVLGRFYPGEALVIAFVLAVLPYLLIRGPVARIVRRWSRRGAAYASRQDVDDDRKHGLALDVGRYHITRHQRSTQLTGNRI